MPETQKVRVTLDFEVFASEYLEAMEEVRILLEQQRDILEDQDSTAEGTCRIVKIQIHAKTV